ncbi:MAG: hypothetical protein AAF961_18485, partial [Planctomycetota bacterium]
MFRPTIKASLATLVLASPVTLIGGFLGWRLCKTGGEFLSATGWAVGFFAAAYGMLNLVRHASRRGGLGTHHFGWDERALAAIRRASRSTQLFVLPFLAIAVGVEIARDDASISSLGRLSLILALLVIGVVCFRLFRSQGALAKALAPSSLGPLSVRAFRILGPLAVLIAGSLTVASAAGYHYTAMQLTRRVLITCLFVFACLALRSLLMRWLLVVYRRAAMHCAREKRLAMQAAQEHAFADSPVVEAGPQINLSDVNQQARKLVGVGAAVAFAVSLFLIWGEMLPALNVFSRVALWESGLRATDVAGNALFVTLADVMLAVGIFAFTWFAGRNLPALLEIALLQRLPLDAGARYAASSVTRYAIIVIGIAVG